MKPSDAPIHFRTALLARLAEYGHPNVLVIEAEQVEKQGRVDDGIYWRLTNPTNYGWQARRYDVQGQSANHSEHQLVQAMMTLTAYVHNDDLAGYDSNDLANLAQMCVNSLPFIEQMRRNDIGVQRATPVRTINFTDEADNYAKEASFDVNITFMRTINPATPVVEILDPKLIRI